MSDETPRRAPPSVRYEHRTPSGRTFGWMRFTHDGEVSLQVSRDGELRAALIVLSEDKDPASTEAVVRLVVDGSVLERLVELAERALKYEERPSFHWNEDESHSSRVEPERLSMLEYGKGKKAVARAREVLDGRL